MNEVIKLALRTIMGTTIAVFLCKTFYPDKSIVEALGLGIFLVGMSYFFEYLRKKKTD
ncbi:MAG: hypothetical protein HN737_13075 [Desulfobacterales bacterium]|jgi:hypothetical protein|nr:hypothetical protein [Desulfobacteraceae bacterium]MBT4365328.1 hypothetical protein [Desulfobacteraceae bacterium]MBT7084780.1 hypothetical protein [Desulfobacterales bacterium]MBT7698329.1 hypothetical protein [Desulfobacterales bacterium]